MIEFIIVVIALLFVIMGTISFVKGIKNKKGCYSCNSSCHKCPLSNGKTDLQ